MIIASLSLSILLAVDGFLSEAHVGIVLDENAGKSCPHHVHLMMDFCSCNNEGMHAVLCRKCIQSGGTGKGRGADWAVFGCWGHLGSDCSLKGSFHSVYWAI